MNELKILFLDYDGPMHPDEVYRTKNSGIVLFADGHNLFEHAPLLAELLEPHQDVKIVLSTSWVRVIGFDRAKERLPAALQERIVGATYHKSMKEWFDQLSRYKQILGHVGRHKLNDWIALDNDPIGWPADQMDRLVLCDDWGGLGDLAPQEKLRGWLEK